MKSAHSTSEGREAITEIAITHTRITQSGTRFFQFTSLKLQNGTFETMVTPATPAPIHVRRASQPVGVKPKSTSTQTRPVIPAAPDGLGRPWKERLSTSVMFALKRARRIPAPAQ